MLAFGRNWIKEYQLPIFWLALLFLFDWGVSLLTHCVGREPQQTNRCAEEGYGLAQAISYRLAAIVYDGIERHDGLIAAAATLAIAVFTFTLWRSTDKLWTASKAASERQEQDTRILQRAYISVEPCGVSQWLSDHKTPEAQFIGHIGIRNVGNLPAREISWSIHMKWSESGEIK